MKRFIKSLKNFLLSCFSNVKVQAMKEKISIRQMSKDIGICPATISRAMNHPELVKDETKKLVFEYLEVNGGAPKQMQRTPRKVIGLTFSDPSSLFTSSLIDVLETQLVKTEYQLILFNLQRRRDVYEYFREHVDYLKKVDALIISSSTLSEQGSRFLSQMGIPVVLFHSSCPGEYSVLTNNFKGGQESAQYLLSRGYHNPAVVVWEPSDEHVLDRVQGFRSVFPLSDDMVVSSKLSAEGGYEATKKLMMSSSPPDAVFYACDAMAAGGFRYMLEHKISIPDEVGIMGFDNLPIAGLMGITTMSQFLESEVHMVISYLLDRLRFSDSEHLSDEISITPKLVVRSSTK